MIYFIRSATIAPGKLGPAMAYAREIAAQVKATVGNDVSVGTPVGGNPSRVGWFAQYKDLAEMEQQQVKLLHDAAYLETIGKSADLFVAGSLHDEIWRV